jgi:dihydrofolate reductase
MRKIIMFNMVTVDGYFAGADGNIDWHQVDDEFNSFAANFIIQCDTAIFGRVTYDLFAGFWPTATNENSTPENHTIAQTLNSMRKIVITHKELSSDWGHTEAWKDIDTGKIKELKKHDGKNIVIYGSGTIVQQLTKMGLIDEYHFMVAPVILGGGKSLFEGSGQKQLKLSESKEFSSGNVLLKYSANTKN